MTPIPEDHIDDREERVPAAESARRLAAAISGAIEGFVEAFEEHDLKEEAKRSLHDAGEVARAATEEGRAQAQTPEMQQLGGYAKTAGHATADAARAATGAVRSGATHAADAVGAKAHDAAETVRGNVERAREATAHFKEEVRVRAEAVAETGRRARVAPGRIARELRAGLDAWRRGLMRSLALLAGMAVFATVTLVVLTIALVVGLNELVGDPAGTFLVALLYLVVAGAAFFAARAARRRARAQTRRHVESSREEARNVARPVREAFGRTGI